MKNTFLAFLAVIAFFIPISGCKVTPSQGKVVAKNAGLAAAVTWIAYDNPSSEQTALVKVVIGVIKGVTVDTANGETYSEAVFPVVQNYVETAVENGTINANEAPFVLAGSIALLNGLDLLFATNPDWATNVSSASAIVGSFLSGAEVGLSLADNDPRMINARQSNAKRARVFQQ